MPFLFLALLGDVASLKGDVEALASPAMEGRKAGTDGERAAREFVVGRFKAIGLEPRFQEFRFGESTAVNVVAGVDNRAGSTILIGAHYDHLGFGGPKSRSLTDRKVHPGADDNASGVAVLLLLAGRLKGFEKFDFLFVAFSAHEEGLHGSAAFAPSKLCDPATVRLMVNLDMVGRLNSASPTVRATRRKADEKLDDLLKREKGDAFALRIVEEGLQETDAGAFAERGVPALSLTTGPHEDYHKISDTPEKLNYGGMIEIADWVERILRAVGKE